MIRLDNFITIYIVLLSFSCIALAHLSKSVYHMMILLLIVLGSIFKFRSILKHFPINGFFLSRFFFSMWAITSLSWAVSHDDVINRFFVYTYSLIIVFITFKLINSTKYNEKFIILFFNVSAFSGLILSIDILLYAGYSLLLSQRLGNDAMSINTAATKFAYIGLTQFILYMTEKRCINLIALSYFSVMILLTGSKTAFLMLSIGSIIFYIKTRKLRRRTLNIKNILIVICAILIICISITYIPALYQIFGRRFIQLFQIILGQVSYKSSYSTSVRVGLLQEGWSGFLKKPFTGWGENNMLYFSSYHQHGHSSLIEILFNLGIVGFFSYFFPYFMICSSLISGKNKNEYSAIATAILTASILEITTSISHNDLLNWLMLLFAYIYTLKRKADTFDALR